MNRERPLVSQLRQAVLLDAGVSNKNGQQLVAKATQMRAAYRNSWRSHAHTVPIVGRTAASRVAAGGQLQRRSGPLIESTDIKNRSN